MPIELPLLPELPLPPEPPRLHVAPLYEWLEAGGDGGVTLGRGTVARGTEGAFGFSVEPPTMMGTAPSLPRLIVLSPFPTFADSFETLATALLLTKRCWPGS